MKRFFSFPPPLSRLIDDRYIGFPGGSDGQESACSAGVLGSIPGLGRSPGEGNSCPLQYSCLEIPGREGQATVHGVTKSDMTEWLSHYFQALYSVPSIYSNIRFCTNATLLWWLSLCSVVWSQEVCSSCFISYIFPLQRCFLTLRSFVVPYKCWDLFSYFCEKYPEYFDKNCIKCPIALDSGLLWIVGTF